ncbi:MAG: UMP kinase [Defluviitaleaceae bacterium]|nr:UMP kinase [Defluviitaleaceae bacterium]
MLKRVVIKLSGEAIGSANSESGYNDSVVDAIVKQIITVMQAGTEVALVVGGGNIWRGLQARPDMDRVKADQMGMLATIMNAVYLEEAFKRQGQKSRVLTPMPVGNITTVYDKDHALEWMYNGIVLINAAGIGHPMFSTDTVTALRAAELEADCALYAKSIDGVYDSEPKHNPSARKYEVLNYNTAITKSLQAADLAALHLSKDAKMPAYMFGLNQPNSIIEAAKFPATGSLKGTYIHVDKEDKFYD